MGKLDNKAAIITGGASGIGAETAKLFLEEGAKAVIVEMNEEKGKTFEQELKEQGKDVLFVKADVTNETDIQHVFSQTKSTFGGVDILFNNAGIGAIKPTEDLPFSEWRKTLAVDLDGVFLFAQAAIKEFLQSGGGVIVNTASM